MAFPVFVYGGDWAITMMLVVKPAALRWRRKSGCRKWSFQGGQTSEAVERWLYGRRIRHSRAMSSGRPGINCSMISGEWSGFVVCCQNLTSGLEWKLPLTFQKWIKNERFHFK
uniref:Uncharacterized protein n=1 Tax=Vitis vinifera TaxID=29760 RepID=A5AVP0_VITVI|nr:hypothetical protein VITISV_039745 [Vitis vinifera]